MACHSNHPLPARRDHVQDGQHPGVAFDRVSRRSLFCLDNPLEFQAFRAVNRALPGEGLLALAFVSPAPVAEGRRPYFDRQAVLSLCRTRRLCGHGRRPHLGPIRAGFGKPFHDLGDVDALWAERFAFTAGLTGGGQFRLLLGAQRKVEGEGPFKARFVIHGDQLGDRRRSSSGR